MMENNTTVSLDDQLKELESLGFSNRRKNEKLLKKSGQFVLVRNFLTAQAQLKESNKQGKKCRCEKGRFEKGTKQRPKNKDHCGRQKEKKHRHGEVRHGKHQETELPDVEHLDVEAALSDNKIWPENATHLYLDGNNMMFVLAPLRQMAINQRNVPAAELTLQSMAKKFTEVMNLEYCLLIFDDTKLSLKEVHFEVNSARPNYKTSDDALVQIAQQVRKGVYVTSDRELASRLLEVGVTVMRPTSWFEFVAKIMDGNEAPSQTLDDWATKWVNSISQDMESKLSI